MQQFKYYIRKKSIINYLYYSVDNAGVVVTNTTPTPLVYSPDGWQDSVVEIKKGFVYHGLFTNYSQPFKLVKDGAKILKQILYVDGYDKYEFQVLSYNPDPVVCDYEPIYIGDISYSTISIVSDYVEFMCEQQGLLQKVKAYENTKYDIDEGSVKVKLEGILQKGISYHNIGQTTNDLGISSGSSTAGKLVVFESTNYEFEGYNSGEFIFFDNTDNSNGFQVTHAGTGNNLKLKAVINGAITVAPCFDSGISTTITYEAQVVNISNTLISTTVLGTRVINLTTSPITNQAFNITANVDLGNIPQDSKVRLVVKQIPSGTRTAPVAVNVSIKPNSIANFTIKSKMQPIYVKTSRSSTVFESLCTNIAGVSGTNINTLFWTNFFLDNIVLCSGNALRGVANSKITTSLKQLFEAYDMLVGAALIVTDSHIEICLKSKIYNASAPLTDLGKVTAFKVKLLAEEMFSTLKFGYGNYSYDDINGKDEFNKERNYKLSNTVNTNTKSIVCPYRADTYGIAQIRNQFNSIDTADTADDSSIYMIHVDLTQSYTDAIEGTYYKAYKMPAGSVANMLDNDNVINVLMSPKYSLIRNLPFIKSLCELHSATTLTNTATSKIAPNGELQVTIASTVHDEATDLSTGVTNTKLFYPFVMSFELTQPNNILAIMNNAYNEFKITYDSKEYKGFLLSISLKPGAPQRISCELLATTNNNLIDFI
jgi:hypothetical protein